MVPYKEAPKIDPEMIRAAVKEGIAENVHTQFSAVIMPTIESHFKV